MSDTPNPTGMSAETNKLGAEIPDAAVTQSLIESAGTNKLGAEIPSLGGANGRPANKKLIAILFITFVLIASLLFYLNAKLANRNKNVVAKPEAAQDISAPEQTERLVPPLEQLTNSKTSPAIRSDETPLFAANVSGAAPSATANRPGATPELGLTESKAIPLFSEKTQRVAQSQEYLTKVPDQSGPVGKAIVLSLAERRSKLGGKLMMENVETDVSASDATRNESSWKKRLLSSGFQSSKRADADLQIPATVPKADAAGMLSALAAPLLGARGVIPGNSANQSDVAADDDPMPASLGANVAGTAARGGSTKTIEARRLASDKDYLIPRGSSISCALDTRLVSDISGQTSCTVNANVYSMNGAYRLIPKGSRLTGTYKSGAGDNDRLAVIWDRILTPGGIDVAISDPGTDTLGGTGVPGDFDGHWGKKLTTAILVSLAGDVFKLGSVKYGPMTTITKTDAAGVITKETKPYESILVDTMSKIPAQVAAKTLALPGTITVVQGQLVNVVTTRDIDFRQVKTNL